MSEKIKNMFSSIAENYDQLNDVLSLGIHRGWRRKAVKIALNGKADKVLDCACGTGDFAFDFYNANSRLDITGLDFCQEMLDIAVIKAEQRKIRIPFINGDVLNLPFDDNTFDIASIGFGIRNVDDVKAGIAEMARVVNSGGRVIILEFGRNNSFFAPIYNLYSKFIIPILGKIVSKSEFAYDYLPTSAAKFPSGNEFLNIMQSTGAFKSSYFKSLTFGIAYIYVGEVK